MVARSCRRPRDARSIPAAAAIAVLLAACEPASDRPALAAFGPGGPVDPAMVVGTWLCSDLNPYPDQPSQAINTTYAADGSYRSTSLIPERGPFGAIAVTQHGRWAVQGDRLVTSEVVTEARAVDGNSRTDYFARAGAQTVDAMSAGKPAASEVLRLDARRLTLRPAGVRDPPAIGCARQ